MTPFNIKMNSLKANSVPLLHVSVNHGFSVHFEILELSLISSFPSSSILRHQIPFVPLLEYLFLLLSLCLTLVWFLNKSFLL